MNPHGTEIWGLFVTEANLTNTEGKIIDVTWKNWQNFDRKI